MVLSQGNVDQRMDINRTAVQLGLAATGFIRGRQVRQKVDMMKAPKMAVNDSIVVGRAAA